MKEIDRRALLETIAESSQSDQFRLKALELLDTLDERERQERERPERPDLSETDDPERLTRLIDLLIESGLLAEFPAFREQVERRAEEIVEQRATERRSQFAAVEQTTPDAAVPEEAQPEADEQDEPEKRTHPLDEVSFRFLRDDDEPPPSLLSRRGR